MNAPVFWSVLGGDAERTASLEGLQAAHGFLQGRVAHALRLKHTPAIVFDYDESVDRGMRISELLEDAVPIQEPGADSTGPERGEPEVGEDD